MEVLSVFYNRKRSTIYDPSSYGRHEPVLRDIGKHHFFIIKFLIVSTEPNNTERREKRKSVKPSEKKTPFLKSLVPVTAPISPRKTLLDKENLGKN